MFDFIDTKGLVKIRKQCSQNNTSMEPSIKTEHELKPIKLYKEEQSFNCGLFMFLVVSIYLAALGIVFDTESF